MAVLQTLTLIVRLLLGAALAVWTMTAPILWILRDGLGPEMVESTGEHAASKFLLGWGIPALLMAVSLVGLTYLVRRFPKPEQPADESL
jgi:hypothetical protein